MIFHVCHLQYKYESNLVMHHFHHMRAAWCQCNSRRGSNMLNVLAVDQAASLPVKVRREGKKLLGQRERRQRGGEKIMIIFIIYRSLHLCSVQTVIPTKPLESKQRANIFIPRRNYNQPHQKQSAVMTVFNHSELL